MFADDNPNNLTPDKKYFCEIISMISLIFSTFVLIVSKCNVKSNVTNNLIMQIIMAEILDGINIILGIAIDAHGEYTFENYPSRMGLCLTQIYLGVFSCLWNLFSSLFISIRIYDKMKNKSRIFKNKIMYEYTTTMSYGIPGIISYILWTSQVLMQSNILENKTYKDYYETEYNSDFFRYMYCWVSRGNNWALIGITIILIGANISFSVINVCFIGKISREIEESEGGEGKNAQNKIKRFNTMKTNLIIYPIVSILVWLFYFVLQILTGYINGPNKNETISKSMKHGAGAWLLIIIISIRQIIFTLVFFFTQKNLKRHAFSCLKDIFCKRKKNESVSDTTGEGLLDKYD